MKDSLYTSLGRLSFGLVLAILGTTAQQTASAHAREHDGSAITVSFSDLDLSRSEGVEQLYRRIRAAAHTVCHSLEGVALDEKYLWWQCVDGAVDAAVARVDEPGLTAYYRARASWHHAVGPGLVNTRTAATRP